MGASRCPDCPADAEASRRCCGDGLIEMAAGLGLVLLATGPYFWWPRRGRSLREAFVSPLSLRDRPSPRRARDLVPHLRRGCFACANSRERLALGPRALDGASSPDKREQTPC
ncbi:hypothetical protein RSP03_17220 [Cereibacter sphaeroides]|jgi:hypothetical protein|nr:PepSY domain-containing protein [Cereibacter sphaeroides 2.4.1]GEM92655.1 hypothetical protein RSP03_17220 [Cereibacter sphaeroides]